MLNRLATAMLLWTLLSRAQSEAGEKDHLQRGEPKLTAQYEIKYDRAIRDVLSRGWRSDVVLRMVDLPSFQPEWVAGIARAADGYRAFDVTASKLIWGVLGFGADDPKRKRGDYHSVRPVLHERALSASIATRIATLWRRVLGDPRNYGKDPGIYLDTDQFTFHLSFLPRESITANMTGWGARTEQLINIAGAIADHANGAPEGELVKAVTKAERKLGIQPINEANGPIASRVQRACHRPRPWLISFSLGVATLQSLNPVIHELP